MGHHLWVTGRTIFDYYAAETYTCFSAGFVKPSRTDEDLKTISSSDIN